MNIYNFYNMPTKLNHWHKDDPNNKGVVKYRNKMGELHREDGPAVIFPDNTKIWCLHGKYHREDGPAVVYGDGGKEWYLNGCKHRISGPAVIWPDGTEEWYLNGKDILDLRS